MSARAAVVATSLVLDHVPDLVRYGSKPRRESTRWPEIAPSLRSFDDAVAYPPNQVVHRQPSARRISGISRARGGSNRSTTRASRARAATSWTQDAFYRAAARGRPVRADPGWGRWRRTGQLPLFDGDRPSAGGVPATTREDASLAPDVLLENLAIKASGVHALRHLLAEPASIRRRSPTRSAAARRRSATGTSAAAATSRRRSPRRAGCTGASGDRREVVLCGARSTRSSWRRALLEAGDRASGSSWSPAGRSRKLGMKFEGALDRGLPHPRGRARRDGDLARARRRLERPDRCGPTPSAACRVGAGLGTRRRSSTRSSAARWSPRRRGSPTSAPTPPRSTTRRSPSRRAAATSPTATTGCSPGSAVVRGELDARRDPRVRPRATGMPGFSPTQGHIAAPCRGCPHALARMAAGDLHRTMLIAKGSLFLGRLTPPMGRRHRRPGDLKETR